MKITRIYAEAKVSRNFQTYTVGMEGTLTEEEADNHMELSRALQAKCRKLAKEQSQLDAPVTHKLE